MFILACTDRECDKKTEKPVFLVSLINDSLEVNVVFKNSKGEQYEYELEPGNNSLPIDIRDKEMNYQFFVNDSLDAELNIIYSSRAYICEDPSIFNNREYPKISVSKNRIQSQGPFNHAYIHIDSTNGNTELMPFTDSLANRHLLFGANAPNFAREIYPLAF